MVVACVPVGAQSLAAGLKAGVPLTSLAFGPSAETRRYTFGPSLELGLRYGLSFEADLLYKRFGFSKTATAGRWEVPLLLKYRLTEKRAKPFFAAGTNFNRIITPGTLQVAGAELRHRSTRGLTGGCGVELGTGLIHIVPEFRVTRWADRNFGVRDAALRSNLTQAEVLFGVLFRP